jgi:hypothetical protein
VGHRWCILILYQIAYTEAGANYTFEDLVLEARTLGTGDGSEMT